MPGFAGNSAAVLKLGTNSGGGKILCLVLKSWLTILQMEKEELVNILS
jgi:hypothetical protein